MSDSILRRAVSGFPCKSKRPNASIRGMGGFSLIELLIVISILGVLLGVAIPNYSGFLERTRRTDARTALLDIAAAQERHFFEQRQYSGSMVDVWNHQQGGAFVSAEGHYVLSLTTANGGQTYIATATAQGKQKGDDDCASLTIDETGKKAATAGTGGDPSVCW